MPPKNKKTSGVWEYFEVVGDKAKCKLCDTELMFNGSSTSSLLKHARIVHKKLLSVGDQKTNQKTLVDVGIVRGRPLDASRKAKINDLVADVIAENNLPFRFVESQKFRELISYLEPNFKPPCAETMKTIIESKAAELRSNIKRDLETADHLALVTDNWTSSTNDSYMAITSSYIDKSWNLKTPVLQTRHLTERHYANYLQDEMTTVMQNWEVEKNLVAIVHDNASNVKKIAQSVKQGCIDVACAAHTLQICINNAMGLNKNHPISRTVGAASRLVGHFSHSTMATNELLKRQSIMRDAENRENESNTNYKLIQYVRTRWNSIFEMFERLLKLRWPVTAVLSDRQVTKFSDAKTLDLTSEQWLLIENILPTLKNLKVANTVLCGEKYVSISCVLPVIKTLVDSYLINKDEDVATVQKFKEDLRANLTEKFCLNSQEVSVYLLASALDPRYKDFNFVGEEIKEKVYEELETQLNNENEIQEEKDHQGLEVEEITEPEPGPSKRAKLSDEVDDFFSVSQTTEKPSLSNEIAQYKVSPGIPRNECPLKWWSKEERNMPSLANLAKKYLCIPATSVAAERHFSAAGRTITKIRNRLLPDTTDVLLFVNRNMKLGNGNGSRE